MPRAGLKQLRQEGADPGQAMIWDDVAEAWSPGDANGTENNTTTTDATATTIATLPLDSNSVVILSVFVVGRRTDVSGFAGFYMRALVRREAAGALLEGKVHTPFTRVSDKDYVATLEVSGNDALVRVQGKAGHTLNWRSCHTQCKVG